MESYTIKKTETKPELSGDFTGKVWGSAKELILDRPLMLKANDDESLVKASMFFPDARAKLLYDDEYLYGIYSIKDKYVKCVHTNYNEETYKDSCCEFFISPDCTTSYINFEINASGTIYCSFMKETAKEGEKGKRVKTLVPEELGKQIKVYHSLPSRIEEEIQEDTEWQIEFAIPFSLIEQYFPKNKEQKGSSWTANLYKCADETSHPHWATWCPIVGNTFHAPESFGKLIFE